VLRQQGGQLDYLLQAGPRLLGVLLGLGELHGCDRGNFLVVVLEKEDLQLLAGGASSPMSSSYSSRKRASSFTVLARLEILRIVDHPPHLVLPR
jgi:hypothetical protein